MRTDVVTLVGLTADERIEEFGQILDSMEHDNVTNSRMVKDMPQFNLITTPIHTGHKAYIEWGIKQTTKTANSLTFKPLIVTNSTTTEEAEEQGDDKGKEADDESKVQTKEDSEEEEKEKSGEEEEDQEET